MPLNFQLMQIPFSGGLNTKGDPRAKQPPQLDICKDARFDNVGGLEARFPFATSITNILGGGTITNARKLVVNGNELLCFTADTLYSWSSTLNLWIAKGTHLAVTEDERTVFATTGDQVDTDRAELNGTVVYTWTQGGTGVYVASLDKATGAVIATPAIVGPANGTRPRLTTLGTKILLTFVEGGATLVGVAIDPANVATSLGVSATSLITLGLNYYDIVKIPGADSAIAAMRLAVNGGGHQYYTIAKITSALAVTTVSPSRTCDGPIAVSCTPDGVSLQVVRGNTTNVQGDLITISSLADVYTAQAIGTAAGTINQIAACHRSVTNSSHYRCYAFWSASEDPQLPFVTMSNWVDDGNTLGSAATFVSRLGVGSRAFSCNGSVYVWLTFAGASTAYNNVPYADDPPLMDAPGTAGGALQNTYFLYRDDAFLAAKAADGNGAGFRASIGHLPGVALTAGSTTFSWLGGQRRIVPVGNQNAYAARDPRDIMFTFDDNRARRCVRLGQTLYIAGGMILQYDGVQLVEIGFCVYPWLICTSQKAPGALIDGGYSYKFSYRSDNAQGERDRSTTATTSQITTSGGPTGVQLKYLNLFVTRRLAAPTLPAVEAWRTAINPAPGAPYYLVTSQDPSKTSPNNYIPNDPTTTTLVNLLDELADINITGGETNPENGAALPNIQPPPATVITATDTRIFLAGIAGLPDQVWYSMQRPDGLVAGFNDALVFNVPPAGGAIVAIADFEGAKVVFRQTATYLFSNDGFDNTGLGANYALAKIISTDLGAESQEAVALGDQGLYVKTNKGIQLLDKSFTYQDIGEPVAAYNSEPVLAMHVLSTNHEVRVLTANRMLVLDTLVNQWGERTINDGLDATIWNGTYAYLSATGPRLEQSTFTTTGYGMDIETVWLKPNDLQGFARVRRMMLLGEWQSACSLKIQTAYNYRYDGSGNPVYTDVTYWNVTPTVAGSALQVRIGLSQQKCESVKFRITVVSTANDGTPLASGEGARFTGIALEVGIKPGLFRQLPAAQKQ